MIAEKKEKNDSKNLIFDSFDYLTENEEDGYDIYSYNTMIQI